MSDVTFATDVDRHFTDLEAQLRDDEIEKGSDVHKTLRRLKRSLKKDGFSLTEQEEAVEEAPVSSKKKRTKTTVVTTDPVSEFVIRAFRVGNEVDANIVTTVFTEIDGWKTQTVNVKGRHFVVVTNAPRFSKKRIKVALTTLIQERRESSATA